MSTTRELVAHRIAPLHTPGGLKSAVIVNVAGALNLLPADVFGLPDVAAASLVETWIDDAERRGWFLFDTRALRE